MTSTSVSSGESTPVTIAVPVRSATTPAARWWAGRFGAAGARASGVRDGTPAYVPTSVG